MHKSHSILATGVYKQALKNAGAFQVYEKCQLHLFPLPHVSAEEAVCTSVVISIKGGEIVPKELFIYFL